MNPVTSWPIVWTLGMVCTFTPMPLPVLRCCPIPMVGWIYGFGYRVTPRHILAVDARFDCPDPGTIVMTITGGEGIGSVVETHATPLHRAINTAGTSTLPRTAVIEATLATSDRPGFALALRGAVIARPMIELLAGRLWKDEALYAERTYKIRTGS